MVTEKVIQKGEILGEISGRVLPSLGRVLLKICSFWANIQYLGSEFMGEFKKEKGKISSRIGSSKWSLKL